MDQKLVQALNEQITHERYNADAYTALALILDDVDLTGCAHWMYKQADEERTHAKRFSDYVLDRNLLPYLDALQAPETPLYDSPSNAGMPKLFFEFALGLEKQTTQHINDLYALAWEVKDYMTCEALLWFIHEQVEEERQIVSILNRLSLADNGAAILIIDEALGER